MEASIDYSLWVVVGGILAAIFTGWVGYRTANPTNAVDRTVTRGAAIIDSAIMSDLVVVVGELAASSKNNSVFTERQARALEDIAKLLHDREDKLEKEAVEKALRRAADLDRRNAELERMIEELKSRRTT